MPQEYTEGDEPDDEAGRQSEPTDSRASGSQPLSSDVTSSAAYRSRSSAGAQFAMRCSIAESGSVVSEAELEPPELILLLRANRGPLGRLLVHFAEERPGQPPPPPGKARLSMGGWSRLCNECGISPPLPKHLVSSLYTAHARARRGRVGFAAMLELLAECTAARRHGGAGEPYFAGVSGLQRGVRMLEQMARSKAALAVVAASSKPLFMTSLEQS